MFSRVLIANRGEIACRIIRTLRDLGIRSIAVYSDADAGARHVRLADDAVRLGPAPAAQSYLDIDAVVGAAVTSGADAVHPGYGFLAESAAFARACAEVGLVFIGPSPEAIETMGDKIRAKDAVAARGVPVVPGVARPGLTDDDLQEAADAVGFPLLIKPSAGGGGKGMHVVDGPDELAPAIAAARREAAASFGDDTLFLERYLPVARHIEVQVLADDRGAVVHLGERECSLQRRHQKVIEEAPSPFLDAATRARIGEAACETARSVGYRGAGTVEFIVDAHRPDEFFFMEMNTRLQVEHPVTEAVTGVDLVAAQLRIAAGEPLDFAQDDIALRGHAIEARVYAEDPAEGFLPTGGEVLRVVHPEGAGIRVDTAIDDATTVSVDYDPMLAKIIAHGRDRDEARSRLVAALEETAVFGFATNVAFVRGLLELPAVAAGELDTGLIARESDAVAPVASDERTRREAALLLGRIGPEGIGPWHRRDGWRLGEPAPREYRFTGAADPVRILGPASAPAVLTPEGLLPASVAPACDGRVTVVIDGRARTFAALVQSDRVLIARGGAVLTESLARDERATGAGAEATPTLESPMPGTVVAVRAEDGARVQAGDPVLVVEAMKMEHVVRTTVEGTVRLHAVTGDSVARGQLLAVIHPDVEEKESA